ncbi:hypothetical protein M378DRAFT_161903 [Amanita muscaria Koide BX008]|uniref:Uncharacterized protein n=1 Tax=Amanita muscaria (strain Koide BX008) TaxID=946122 RepID=A0A0C2TFF8_AMAMK|nr:hypothetical protein M378DRAFT_161903 [Amanita muscaria Koide BX008]
MVVMRRVPVPPPPPTSRSASTQNAPRVSHTKSRMSQQPADATSKSAQSVKQNLPSPPTLQNGRKAQRPKRSRFRIPSLSWLLLTIFSLYALSTLHPSPAQSLYKAVSIPYETVIKPYLLPPLRTALSHPVIEHRVTTARTTVQPYAQRVDTTTRPILKKLSQVEQYRIRPLVRHGTLATFRVVQKAWSGIVVHNYRTYLRPHIQPYLARCSSIYHRTVGPTLRTLAIKSYLLYGRVKPHVTNALIKFRHYSTLAFARTNRYINRSYNAIQPHVIAFWVKAQPHVRARCKFLKLQAVKGLSVVRVYASSAATRLGDARREFVDPHLKRIWDKVEDHSVVPSSTPLSSSKRLETSAAPADFTTKVDAVSVTESPIPPSPTSIEAVVSTSLGEEPLESAASIISDSIGLGVAAETPGHEEMDPTWIVLPTISVSIPSPEATSTELTKAAGTTTVPAPVPAVSRIAKEEDVDDFLQELGISADETPKDAQPIVADSSKATIQPAFSARQEDDGAAATLRAKVAAKRASIVKRHSDWQAQLDELYGARERDLRNALVSLRKNAVGELRGLSLRDDPRDEKVVVSIEQEADRLAKGVEGYLKKERDRKEKLGREWYDQLEEKKNQWAKVLNKVDDKFAEKVKGAQEEVHAWYVGVREKEGEEVLKTSSELKSLAETAQANLGLDYAWLEDVTYEDWQRYHDLMRIAERFEETARAIQNGTHAHPPVDPLTLALEVLEGDVQGVIDGFRARFSMLRTEGNDLYTKEKLESPGSSSSSSTSSEPTMSILPISSDGQGDMVDASNIILSKSEEQIKQALGAAGYAVDETRDHREL